MTSALTIVNNTQVIKATMEYNTNLQLVAVVVVVYCHKQARPENAGLKVRISGIANLQCFSSNCLKIQATLKISTHKRRTGGGGTLQSPLVGHKSALFGQILK